MEHGFRYCNPSLLGDRERLPIWDARSSLVREIFARGTSIVIGETGSGKSTQVAQFLCNDERFTSLKRSKCICVTQPRRVAAMSIAGRLAEEMGVPLGQEVGYAVRFEENCSRTAMIRVVTDGMLLREAMIDPSLSRYSVVILDEAHERTVQTDLLISLLKRIQRERGGADGDGNNNSIKHVPLRLVIMSATLNPAIFLGYFNLDPSAVLYIEGRQYPVTMFYTQESVEDFLDAARQCIFDIHLQRGEGDILVFLDGQENIEALRSLCLEHAKQHSKKMTVLPLYAALPPRYQMRVFEPSKHRKVILATNIAETSLTIPGVVYVVDSGLLKVRTFDGLRGISRLQSVPVSRAAARQRAGRAGRQRAGVCYRLYTEDTFFKELEEVEQSEIQRTNVSSVVLTLMMLGVTDVVNWDYMERPRMENIASALEELHVLGAVDAKMSITPLGKQLAVFPLDPTLAKVIIVAHEKHVLHDVCAIVAMITGGSVLVTPVKERDDANKARATFRSKFGDHLTLRNIFFQFQAIKGKRRQWCKAHYVNRKAIEIAERVYEQLVEYAEQTLGAQTRHVGPEGLENDVKDAEVLKCFICGFYRNVAMLNLGTRTYRTFGHSNLEEVLIHPSSALHQQSPPPPTLLFAELVITSKYYMRDVSAIDPLWLAQALPNVYRSMEVQMGM